MNRATVTQASLMGCRSNLTAIISVFGATIILDVAQTVSGGKINRIDRAMMDKEMSELIVQIMEEMKDIAMREIDPKKGKICWPMETDDLPSINDAYATLFSLSNAELCLSFYDETGNIETDTLSIQFQDIYPDEGNRGVFARRSLKELLEEELQPYIDENTTESRRGQLLTRLVKAFEEPA
jgi:hypothetical protein